MGKPFKNVSGGPGTGPQKSAEESAAPAPGTGILNSQKTGNPLSTPSEQVVEGRAHGHSPRIPWPPAQAELHETDGAAPTPCPKPFKV